jgi:Holliday junction resolvase-like predicted endonuclease
VKYKIEQFNKKRKQKKRFARGLMLENRARSFLRDKGYSIVSEQEICYHRYKVNGKNFQSKIILDYVVKKNNKNYIVEVKSGKSAISVQDKNSRRQLLEYDFVIENDGIFLLDMENRVMNLVEFSSKEENQNLSFYKFLLIIAVLGILIPFWKIKILLILIVVVLWKYPERAKTVMNNFL